MKRSRRTMNVDEMTMASMNMSSGQKKSNTLRILLNSKYRELRKMDFESMKMVSLCDGVEVSILPYMVNAMLYSKNVGISADAYRVTRARIKDMTNMDEYGEDFMEGLIGKEDYAILKTLLIRHDNYSNTYSYLRAMASRDEFTWMMLKTSLCEALQFDENLRLLASFSEGTDNTLALSYYLSLKWFRDCSIIPESVIFMDGLDEIIDKLLKNGDGYRKVAEGELKYSELAEYRTTPRKDILYLTPLEREALEDLGVDTDWIIKDAEQQGLLDIKTRDDEVKLREYAAGYKTIAHVMLQCYNGVSFEFYKCILGANMINDRLYAGRIAEGEKAEKKCADALKKLADIQNRSKSLQKKTTEMKRRLDEQRKKNRQLDEKYRKLESGLNGGMEKEIERLKAELASEKEKHIKEIQSTKKELEMLKKKKSEAESLVDSVTKENSELKEINAGLSDAVDGLMNVSEHDKELPFEVVLDEVVKYKHIAVGGHDSTIKNLRNIGVDIRTSSVTQGKKYAGQEFDVLVVMADCVKHKAVYSMRNEAVRRKKMVVYVSSSNVEIICREIYKALKG